VNAERAEPSGGTFALLTSPGPAAIAVLRLTGPLVGDFLARHVRAASTAKPAWSVGALRRATLTDATGEPLDDILVTVLADKPAWDVQLHLHGNPWLVRRGEALLAQFGFTPAEATSPLLWPVADLIEAEATALLPHVLTLRGAQWVLSQVTRLREATRNVLADKDLASASAVCRAIAARRRCTDRFTPPARIVLAGPTNAGKSTLANALADRAASIVSPQPGTTRDWVEVHGEADGHPVTWIDTASLRASVDPLEAAGITRTRELIRSADAVVVVLDASPAGSTATSAFISTYAHISPACVVLNKCDLLPGSPSEIPLALPAAWQSRMIRVSALQRTNLPELLSRTLASLGRVDRVLDEPCAFTDALATAFQAAGSTESYNQLQAKLLEITP